jgi:hypothetical protein
MARRRWAAGQITNSGLQASSGTGWTPVKAGDFNNDGYSDLVYYNASLGDTEIQLLKGASGVGGGMLSNSSFENLPGWTVAGVGNSNKDGHSDLVYYNASLSETQIQLLNGTTGAGGGKLSNSSFEDLPGWTVAGVGDFNHDGKDDLVYYNASTGVMQIQFLNGITGIGGGVIQNSPLENNPSWSVVGVGDFNHDGIDDLVYYNSGTNVYELQSLNGIVATSTQQIGSASGLASGADQSAATNLGQPDDSLPATNLFYALAPMELPFADSASAPREGWLSENNVGSGPSQAGWLTQQATGASMAALSEPIADPGTNASTALAGALLHDG